MTDYSSYNIMWRRSFFGKMFSDVLKDINLSFNSKDI